MPGVANSGGLPDAHRLKALLDLIGIESISDLPLSRERSLDRALRFTYRYCHQLFRPEEHTALEFYRGLLHLLWGDCTGALHYFEMACAQARRLNHKRLTALCCLSIGCMRLTLANVPDAMSQYRYVWQCIESGRRHLTTPAWHPAHDARHLFWNSLEEVWQECWQQGVRRLHAEDDEEEQSRPESDVRATEAEAAAAGSAHARPEPELAPAANGHGRGTATAEATGPHIRVAFDMRPRPPAPPPPVSEHITQILTPLLPRLATMPEPQENGHAAPPTAFVLQPGYEFFKVRGTLGEQELLPGLTPEDWLVVHTQAQYSSWGNLVVVGMNTTLPALRVDRYSTRASTRFLYLLRHQLRGGRASFCTRSRMWVQISRPDQWVGNVVGFYRTLQLPTQRMIGLGPPIILGEPEPILLEPPAQRILRLADQLQLYCVTEKDGYYNVFPEVQVGDWLIVSTSERRLNALKPSDALVLGGPHLQGSVRLQPDVDAPPAHEPFLAQFVRAEHGAIEFFTGGAHQPTLFQNSDHILGVVLGFFRYVKRT